MRPCYVIDIVTPKKFGLRGLWFGPKKPERVIVWVHGLTSSAFSMLHIVDFIVDSKTAVLTFNNRGHDVVSTVHSEANGRSILAGSAHEVFTDCVDDIQGAVDFARKAGVKKTYLAGHSTGCQKSIYWAAKDGRRVKGIMLSAPISDWSAKMHVLGKNKLAHAESIAHSLVNRKKKHSLLPEEVWSETLDAQRFLSLYTPDSAEEIFSYAQPKKNPTTLRKVRIPTLVLLGESDEYADRPAAEIAGWFKTNLKVKNRIVVVPKVGHSFCGGEEVAAKEIAMFMKER